MEVCRMVYLVSVVSALRKFALAVATAIPAWVVTFSSASGQVVWNYSGIDSWNNSTWWGGIPPASGQIPWVSSGGTAVIDTAGSYPASGSFAEVWAGNGGNGNGNGNIVQDTGTTVSVANWFEVGRMYQYAGSQVSAANNVSTYTMYGNSVVNSTANTEISGGWTNGNGLSNSTGILTLNDSAQFNTTSWIALGQWDSGGVGIINLNDNSTINVTGGGASLTLADLAGNVGIVVQSGSSVFNLGNNGNNISFASVGASGTGIYMLNGGTLNAYCNYNFNVGDRSGSTGTMHINGGVANITGGFEVGKSATAQGSVTQTAGQVNTDFLIVGDLGGGSYTQSGGLLNSSGNILVGNQSGGIGALSITGGTVGGGGPLMVWDGTGTITISQTGSTPTLVTPAWITLGQNVGSGTLTQNGGVVATTVNHLWLGYGAAATGTYYLNGGSLTVADIRTDSGTGYFYQDGGSATVNGWLRLGINAGANSTYRLTGGTLTVNGANANVGENGTGSLTIGGSNGGTMVVAAGNNLTVANGSGNGTLDLQNGGLLRTPSIAAGAGTAVFNWSGGTLQNAPTDNLSVSMPVNLSGPGTLAVDNDQTAIFQASAALSGAGGLTKTGLGKLVIGASTNAYTGPTVVQQGTLQLGAVSPLAEYSAEYSASSAGGNTVINLGSGGVAMNGTIVGGVTVSANANHSGTGPALSFGGNAGSYIDIPSGITNLGSGQNWTISGWFETSTPGASLLAKGNVTGGWGYAQELFYLNIGGDNGYIGSQMGGVQYAGGWVTGNTSVDDGSWHYLTISRSGGTAYIYVDGNPDGTSNGMSANNGNDAGGTVRLGWSWGNDFSVPFNGLMDDVRIYGTGLSATQVADLYSTGTLSLPAGQLPSGTALVVASGAKFDLNGGAQQVASLSDAAAGMGGTVTNSNASFPAVLTVTPTGSTTFSGTIQDGNGGVSLVLNGSGTLTLAGTNTYTGGTYVLSGELVLANTEALEDGSDLNVGAKVLNDFGDPVPTALGGSSPSVAPVPEPGTLALLIAGLVVGLGVWRRKKGNWYSIKTIGVY